MAWLQRHLRNKFLAGGFAAVPIVVLVVAAVLAEQYTRPLARQIGYDYPGLGVVIAIVSVYVLGVIVTSVLGGFFLGIADRVLKRVPGLNLLYRVVKDTLVTPVNRAGMFDKVVLVPVDAGHGMQLGFTNGDPLPGDPQSMCVFLPGVPNPIVGRLVLARRESCIPVQMDAEDAFKFLLSTGNYVPEGMRGRLSTESLAP